MKFLFAFIFFIVAVMMSFSLGGREWQWFFISIATIVGFLLGKVMTLSKELTELRESMAKDWESRQVNQTVNKSLDDSSEQSNVSEYSPGQAGSIQQASQQQTPNASISPDQDQLDQPDYISAVNQAAESVETDITSSVMQSANRESSWDTADTILRDADSPKNNHSLDNAIGETSFTSTQKSSSSSFSDKLTNAIKGYFTSGNIFVRIGIIILFFGVSFLLKYVSDRGLFPVEYRLIGVVVGAMFLLGLGWRLRHKNEAYALLLQGAGIGVLYLDVFAAFNLYQLIPPPAAFALLFVVSMLSAALAVLQDSKSLAVLGFSGGFLAPILASSGSNNHVGLFSYYAILNVAIVAIAWFKAWRELNLLGFAFTFIIGSVWGVLSYDNTKFVTTESFLILFFVFYVLIAVLYALRQPIKLKGYADGTLLFGVPLAASVLQYNLVKDVEFGVSISSFAMGAFYMVLAWLIWKRKGTGLKLLAETFLALGVIYASMAIPFALAPTQTAAAWALEGAGFIWLGSRQNRLSVRSFGVLLQFGAGAIFLWRFHAIENTQAFINGEFISSMMLAVGGILSARLLIKPFEGKMHWENFISPVLLAWGLLWLVGDFGLQLTTHFRDEYLVSSMLIFIALLSLCLGLYAVRIKPVWKHAMVAAFLLFLIVILMLFVQVMIALFSSSSYFHPSMSYGWLVWPLVFGVYYTLLYQCQKHELFPRFQSFFHTVLLLFAVLLITLEGIWWVDGQLKLQSAWLGIWLAVPSILGMWLIIKAKLWPFNSLKDSFRKYSGSILAVVLGLWSYIALVDKGASDPLPWLPLLNPLDITLMIVFITLFKWWQSSDGFKFKSNNSDTRNTDSRNTNEADKLASIIGGSIFNNRKIFNKGLLVMAFVALGFFWLNFTLFRVAHHWFDVPYLANALYASSLVQTSVSILWALTGVILTLFASHKNNRLLWVIGAVVLGLVVLKLFVIDLSALGSLGRIISFLVVGALLTSIGYFAPLPDRPDK